MTSYLWSLILASAFIHASWNFAAKKVSGNVCVLWIGYGIACVALFPETCRELLQTGVSSAGLFRMGMTGLLTSLYVVALARAYREGDLSFVYPIARGCGVAGAAVVGRYWFGESISRWGAFGIFTVCMGTMVLSFRRNRHQSRGRDLGFALLTGILLTLCSLNDKAAMGFVRPIPYLFAMCFIPVVLIAPYVVVYEKGRCAQAWHTQKRMSTLVGLGTVASYGLVLVAFHSGPVSYIVPVREFGVVMGSILGFLYLKEPFTLRKGLGIAAITAGLIFLKWS